jgi:hypothetical protein
MAIDWYGKAADQRFADAKARMDALNTPAQQENGLLGGVVPNAWPSFKKVFNVFNTVHRPRQIFQNYFS